MKLEHQLKSIEGLSFSQRLSHNVLLTTSFSTLLSHNIFLTTSFAQRFPYVFAILQTSPYTNNLSQCAKSPKFNFFRYFKNDTPKHSSYICVCSMCQRKTKYIEG